MVNSDEGHRSMTGMDLRTLQSGVRQILANIIKAALASTDERAVRDWKIAAAKAHRELQDRALPLTSQEMDLASIWQQAKEDAQNDPRVRAEENVKPVLQAECLFALTELTAPDLNLEDAVDRVRVSAATG